MTRNNKSFNEWLKTLSEELQFEYFNEKKDLEDSFSIKCTHGNLYGCSSKYKTEVFYRKLFEIQGKFRRKHEYNDNFLSKIEIKGYENPYLSFFF